MDFRVTEGCFGYPGGKHILNHINLDVQEREILSILGSNGVGKTTTIGKLAYQFKKKGLNVYLGAADTFRAAASEQLKEWANRAGVDIISGAEGSDPASVLYDAVNAAKARHVDVLLCDTAGRLHNKKNLMEELKKMHRIIERELPDAKRENLIVLDGTTGQNALAQAERLRRDLHQLVLGFVIGRRAFCIHPYF